MPEISSLEPSPKKRLLARFRIGLMLGVGLLGAVLGWGLKPDGVAPSLPSLPALQAAAMASQAQDNFVLATGFVDDGIEAVFFLDFLTGDLKGGVISERQPGFNAFFEYNIAADFAAAGVKNPKYLMVPGVARNLRQTSNRLGHCVLYVVEATSGQMAAYTVPFNPALYAAGKPQRGPFLPIARAQLRSEYVRDQ